MIDQHLKYNNHDNNTREMGYEISPLEAYGPITTAIQFYSMSTYVRLEP